MHLLPLEIDTESIYYWEEYIEHHSSESTLTLSDTYLDIKALESLSSALSQHKEITSLEINNCSEISELPKDFLQNTALLALSLSHTSISSIDKISHIQTLRLLDLSHTKITELDTLTKFPLLKIINLLDTTVSSFKFMIPSITKIYAPPTIVNFKDFPCLANKKTLTINSIHINSFEGLPTLPNLESIIILKSSIYSFNFISNFPSLKLLKFSILQEVSLPGLPTLRYAKIEITITSRPGEAESFQQDLQHYTELMAQQHKAEPLHMDKTAEKTFTSAAKSSHKDSDEDSHTKIRKLLPIANSSALEKEHQPHISYTQN